MASIRMPSFNLCEKFNGDIPAEWWLDRLDYDFEVADQACPSAPTYLRAISVLLEGEAFRRFRSNHRMKSIMENRVTAGAKEKSEVVEWLKFQYPFDDVEEVSVVTEVSNLLQGADENLTSYYSRTAALLRRTGVKDLDKSAMLDLNPVQQAPDEYVLTSITSAFIKGVRDDKLRSRALYNYAVLGRCLRRTYESLCLSQESIKAQEKVEAEIQMRRYRERLESYVEQHSGMAALVALGAKNTPTYALQQPEYPSTYSTGTLSPAEASAKNFTPVTTYLPQQNTPAAQLAETPAAASAINFTPVTTYHPQQNTPAARLPETRNTRHNWRSK